MLRIDINTQKSGEFTFWEDWLRFKPLLRATFLVTDLSADQIIADLDALSLIWQISNPKLRAGGVALYSTYMVLFKHKELATLGYVLYILYENGYSFDQAKAELMLLLRERIVSPDVRGLPDKYLNTFRDDWVRLALVVPDSLLESVFNVKKLGEERIALLEK